MNRHHQRITKQPIADSGRAAVWSSPICSASDPARRGAWPLCLTALVFTVLFASSCTTSKSSAVPARPGDGLREYQRLVRDLRKDVRMAGQTVEALASVSQKKSGAAYARFDDALQRLEVVSIKARARVEAMEKRGEAYFEEWAEEISNTSNDRRVAQERFAELHGHFQSILKDTGQVRQAFRPFLEGLRGLRTKLGHKPTFAAIETAKPDFAHLASVGRQGEESMDQLLKTLKAAEAAVMSGPLPSAESRCKP